MNNNQELRVKALEIAALIIGPLSPGDRIKLLTDNREANTTLGLYVPLAEAVKNYISENL